MTAHRPVKISAVDDVVLIEVLFSAGAPSWTTGRHSRAFRPATDVYETETQIVVQVEIAGARADDIQITLIDRRLEIRGVRFHASTEPRAYQQLEVNYGDFRSDVDLPDAVDADRAEADYHNGLLTIVLPRRRAQHSVSE